MEQLCPAQSGNLQGRSWFYYINPSSKYTKKPQLQGSAASNNSLFTPWPRPEFCCCQSWTDWLQSEGAKLEALQASQEALTALIAALPCKQSLKPTAGSVQAPLVPTAGIQGHKAPWSLAKPGRTSPRHPELALSSSLSPFLSLLLCHPTSTDIPAVAPEPSHQPAHNGIILMSLVLLPTHSTASTHEEMLDRKGRSAALAPDPEGRCHCPGRQHGQEGLYSPPGSCCSAEG